MSDHHVSLRLYLGVFTALLVLTALTVWSAFQPLGALHTPVALTIAGVKAMLVILYVGAITAFVTATIALVKTDFKRILAFSTLSQLGYMVMSLGAGDSVNAMFHLTTHAMFKGLLFLTAGSVIHAVHPQEITDMGGLRKKMPITFWTFVIGGFALSGFPIITAGFWSKDEILAYSWGLNYRAVFWILAIAAFLTAFYTMRQITLTFLFAGALASAVGTLVERSSGYLMLVKMLDATATSAVEGFSAALNRMPLAARKSMTYDQGREMARHTEITQKTGVAIYFCDPHSPWQRGSNENINGLIRQYLPKGTDLSVHSQAKLNAVARQLNERPRKTLGFETPAERFNACVASIG